MLEESHRAALAVLDDAADEELHRPPAEGAWSVAQVLEHIILTDQSVIPVFKRALREPRPFAGRTGHVERAADRSDRREAPDFVRPRSENKSRAELRNLLVQTRETLVTAARAIGDLDELARRGVDVPHPVFGDISLKEWLEFVSYHEQRHVAQARETLARLRAQAGR
jgi:uncharacterized damage-inducible protein DinB